jgi:hypothetical protein
MLREDGAPVIIDFGAARDFQARHSRSVTAIATAGYAPPEQYGVGGQQGPWSDLYALGAIAYRAVSGVTPIDSLRRLRKDPLIPAVTAGAGEYNEALLRSIDWMLKVDETDRPASVAQVREALLGGPIGPQADGRAVALRDGNGLTPTLHGQTSAAARPPSRWSKIAAVAALLVLAGAAAGSYGLYVNYQATQQAERQQRLLEQLANAGSDQSKLEQFLTACSSDCPDNLRRQAQTRIETVKQQERQAELARQDEAAYRSARGDLIKLRAYVTGCTACGFRTAAQSEISSIEQQQRQAELARQDEASYRAARGDATKLRAYLANCKLCSFKADASTELERLTDDTEYRLARGDIDKLNDYVRSCKSCLHADDARNEAISLQAWKSRQEAPPAKPAYWNAVAASVDTGRVAHVAAGYSGLQSSPSEATQAALERCRAAGGRSCKSRPASNSGCFYITTGKKGTRVAWGSGGTIAEALDNCRSNGVYCDQPIGGCID